ncbi:MAG: nucleotidyltransferase family protein [Betaproteobacteria bacterium]|nr:MAG: nucleotidyltransferase family protein [Betaproteobacteria bacterium]
MKAMILAAGRGVRLRPLTDRLPKPLVEAGGKALLAWHLERLAQAGWRDLVINISHLGEMIEQRFGNGAAWGVNIAWSREAEPLDTAGGLAQARQLLGPDPFLLVNGDIWCEYDFSRLRAAPLQAGLAHLVLAPNPPHAAMGDFSLHDGRVGNAAAPRYTYTGIALLSPRLLAGVAPGEKAPLAPLLRAAAARGEISGELFRGLWRDAGTAERLAGLDALLHQRG